MTVESLSFYFIPRRQPGVTTLSPLDCLYSILTDDILEDLIVMINEFAALETQNTLPKEKGISMQVGSP